MARASDKFKRQTAIDVYLDLARTNYTAYCYYVHEGRWIPSKVGKFITEAVQDFIEEDTGHAYDILAISLPPQHGKSMSITETLPSWYLGRYPLNRVIEVSYSEDFAKLFGRRNKLKIEEFGKDLFEIGIAKSPNSATEFELTNNVGGMISRGVLSGITGRPANLIIIDDPVKSAKEAYSKAYRDSVFNEWTMSMKTRLAAGSKVIVIMTRWHEDDLVGRMLETEQNIRVINLPCEAESGDPLDRNPGEALAPEIGKGDDWLVDFKSSFIGREGSMAWNALFQGRPTSEAGNIFKREWWKFYDILPEDIPLWVMSVDATFKDGDDNDFVSITVWGKKDANIYLVDEVHQKLDFTGTIIQIENLKAKYPKISMTLIEDKANGSAIISILRKSMMGIVPVNPIGGKVSRANAITPYIEAGNVYLPKYADFTEDFINELASFPNGKHDDRVDSTSQALTRLAIMSADSPKSAEQESTVSKFLKKRRKESATGRGEKINVM